MFPSPASFLGTPSLASLSGGGISSDSPSPQREHPEGTRKKGTQRVPGDEGR